MVFSRTADVALIQKTMTHPRLYKWLCREVPANEFIPPGRMMYVAVHEGLEYLGLFAFDPKEIGTSEIHTALLPNAWGRALGIYRQGIEWVWKHTGITRIVGRIRESNRLALRVARRAGLKVFNVVPSDGEPIIELEIRKTWAT